jgi:hypothetical protein
MKTLPLAWVAARARQAITLPPEILAMWRNPDLLSTEGLRPERHLAAAVDWILTAHSMTDDGGISKGYDALRRRWAPSYPETTGYTIPTLLSAALALGRPELRVLAFALAEYLLGSTTTEGGVAHWKGEEAGPIVFDTGQAVFGWLAAFEASGDERYLEAAMRAGSWLVSVQDSSGAWKKGQYLGVEKVIDTRVAWALLELDRHTRQDTGRRAAVANLEWALKHQDTDGWFHHCAFAEGEDPLTHTIAYTAEGLFECGSLLDEARYVEAARLTADALLARQHSDGRLVGTYGPRWRETSRSSCLAGNCQMSCLWLRLFMSTDDPAYYVGAEKAITFVARTQNLETSDSNVRGAIAGSYPVYGQYERFKYPNWAAKFFVDALLALERVKKEDGPSSYVG